MTHEELERGFEMHNQWFADIRVVLTAHEKQMERIEDNLLTAHEKRMGRIEDNLAVQGEMLNKLDQRLDRLVAAVERNTEDVRDMNSAMTALFRHMDAFIRGLERHNGHGGQVSG